MNVKVRDKPTDVLNGALLQIFFWGSMILLMKEHDDVDFVIQLIKKLNKNIKLTWLLNALGLQGWINFVECSLEKKCQENVLNSPSSSKNHIINYNVIKFLTAVS